MHRVNQSSDEGAGCVVAVEIAIDAAVVGLLPVNDSEGEELENQGDGELPGTDSAPNGNVAARSRLSDLPDYAVSGPSGISEGPDNSALRVKFLYQGALGVRSATDDATAQDIASVRCLLGGDAEG